MKRRALWLVALILIAAGGATWWWTERSNVLPRRVASAVAFPVDNPFAGQWTVEDMFPGVTLDRPLAAVPVPGETDTYFVLQQDGLILTIKSGPPAQASTFLDLRPRTIARIESGLLGIAPHPQFGLTDSRESRYVYVFYITEVGGKLYDRLSRFERVAGENRADPATELILIDQLDEDTDHNSGHLLFGPDGMLYVGVGDEGGIGDQFGNGQRIDRDLFSGILRIDVDCRADISHPIRKQPESGRTQGYCIPSDNPFVGTPGALEEFWSIGFRNPHRFAFDGTTLIGGEVGQDRHEQVFVAKRGSNHQWSYREGTTSFAESPLRGQRPSPVYGVESNPVYEYPHTDGNGAVIGGFIYTGTAFPELSRKFIMGDYNSGRVWALSIPGISGTGIAKIEALLRLPPDQRVASFGRDPNGEILICVFGKRAGVLRLRHRS